MNAKASDQVLVRRLVTHALLPFAALPLVGAVVATVMGYMMAAKGLYLAAGVIVVTYSFTILLHPLIKDVTPRMAMALALIVYTMKMGFFLALFMVPELRKHADLECFALGMAPAVLLWPFVHAFILRRVRMPIFDVKKTR